MSYNLGKTGTRIAVNSQVFVILIWFLLGRTFQEEKMRGTRGMRFSKVFIRVLHGHRVTSSRPDGAKNESE